MRQSCLISEKSIDRLILFYIFRAAVEDSSSDDMFGPTQNIESDPSTQSPNLMTKYLSGDSTKIDSPGSFQRLQNISTIKFSTPSFNHEVLKHKLFNHEFLTMKYVLDKPMVSPWL